MMSAVVSLMIAPIIVEVDEEDVQVNNDVQSSCASRQQRAPATGSAAANCDVTNDPAAAATGRYSCLTRRNFDEYLPP